MTTDNEMKKFISQRIGSKFNRCFFPFEECKKEAIKAHSIQNKRILGLLEYKGHVVMPKIKMDFDKGPQVSFGLVGRNVATTFTGLCKDHDNSLFAPIDDNEIDTKNKEHLFLLAFRSVLKGLHAAMKAAIDIQSSYMRGIGLGKFDSNNVDLPMKLATEKLQAAYFFDMYKLLYDQILLDRCFGKVLHREFVLNTEIPTLAVSSVFSCDIFSNATVGPAYMVLNIFPSNNKTKVIFSYLKEHIDEAQTIFSHLMFANQHYLKYEVFKLVLRKCENFVLAPWIYESFNADQIETILNYFKETAVDHDLRVENPKLFLFGPQ